jgi:hypothetical protein
MLGIVVQLLEEERYIHPSKLMGFTADGGTARTLLGLAASSILSGVRTVLLG